MFIAVIQPALPSPPAAAAARLVSTEDSGIDAENARESENTTRNRKTLTKNKILARTADQNLKNAEKFGEVRGKFGEVRGEVRGRSRPNFSANFPELPTIFPELLRVFQVLISGFGQYLVFCVCFSVSGCIFRFSGVFCVDSAIFRPKIPPGARF